METDIQRTMRGTPSQASVRVAVGRDDGSLAILQFFTFARGSSLPDGAKWIGSHTDEELAALIHVAAGEVSRARAAKILDGWWYRLPTDDNILSEVLRAFAVGPQPTTMRVISEADVPADRTYRDALKDTGTALVHDVPKAREIQLARVRHRRVPKLEELDRAMMRAAGRKLVAEAAGDKKLADDHTAYMLEVEAQRQELRDLPVTLKVEEAQTIDEIKAKWSPLLDG